MNVPLPQPFVDRIISIYPDQASKILLSFEKKRATTIRVNTIHATVKEIETYFEQKNIQHSSVKGLPDALIVNALSPREITELPIYTEGKIYIQSLSSMVPVRVLDPQQNERILDMAAAPGSKTSQLGAYMNNTGEIIANDIDRNRLFKLKAIIKTLGVSNVSVTSIPGQALWQKYPEYFDCVLLDAPCSMEGRFDTNDPKSFDHWSLKKVKNLAKLQQWLLRSAISATKVGGTIVYSTCTISPEENEGVVSWILEKEKGNIELEEIVLAGIEMVDGITAFGDKKFTSESIKTKRIVPSELFEAFYVAKFRKVASTVVQHM
ncbi:RsmB/NOP family class I SAM-dependent RNA methyltransferase [soil metagenome]